MFPEILMEFAVVLSFIAAEDGFGFGKPLFEQVEFIESVKEGETQ